MATTDLLARGWRCLRAGDAAQAEQLARQVLAHDRHHAEAGHLLAVSLHRRGRFEEAVQQYEQLLSKRPTWTQVWNDLGTARAMQGRLPEAVAAFRQVLQFNPSSAEAHGNLANALRLQKQLPEAIAHLEEALRLKPAYVEGHHNLGLALLAQGQVPQAIDRFLQALRIQPSFAAALATLQQVLARHPNYPHAYANLGNALAGGGRYEEALTAYREALRNGLVLAEVHNNIGSALYQLRRLDESAASYRDALRLDPDSARAHYNLGVVLIDQGKPDEARAAYEEAVRLQPDYWEALANLGTLLSRQGFADEAIAYTRRAIAAQPERQEIYSNLLLTLHYRAPFDPPAILAEHLRWGSQLSPAPAHRPADSGRGRRLRIGYVSGDFWRHVVGNYIEPVLAARDRSAFEIFCYANRPHGDAGTERIQAHTDHWRLIHGIPDAQVADLIRQDRIDMLVDLAGHTAGNRLGVFALKPAPLQLTHLGYACTTGLAAIDYRLTDSYADPPGQTERFHCERLYRLPEVQWCYRPFTEVRPDVQRLGEADAITFGSLNKLAKVTEEMIACWARILNALPRSRMLLLAGEGKSGDERLQCAFRQHGVNPERLTFLGRQTALDYYRSYQRVDICLDTYPFTGFFTTADAIWMGVPVVSRVGPTWHSRHGVAILASVGLGDLVVENPDAYVETAVRLARDVDRLRAGRAELRCRLEQSLLMDVGRFTSRLETAYRTLWEQHCAEKR